MKVFIGKYRTFIGPYQFAEFICKPIWWMTEDEIHDFGTWLANDKNGEDTLLTKFFMYIESKKKRKINIRIDKYDTWGMDSTLALIILPMLKQLRDTKHGSPLVEMEDVPELLRYTETEDYDSQETFEFYKDKSKNITIDCDVHTRWDWVLNEMIWAFEQLQPDCDWESMYTITPAEIDFSKYTEDDGKVVVPLRWKVKGDYDIDGRMAHQHRISNGLRLFGVYYQGLWD